MLRVAIFVVALLAAKGQADKVDDQLPLWKEKHKEPIGIMATGAGAPIDVMDATVSLNTNLITNEYFMDSITHLARERIPDRNVHAKGSGAFGYFEVTNNVSNICKAKFLEKVGKRTPVAVRFSLVIGEKGCSDTSRDIRGYAVKFYTEEGNFDIPGFNTQMFAYKDPILTSAFVRSVKRNPVTNVADVNSVWDYLINQPESLQMFMLLLSDRGIPDGYRNMPGFGIHTYELVNEYGEKTFVRFHFIPEGGIKNLRATEGTLIAGMDPDYSTRDLYNAIADGNFPVWNVSIQVLTMRDVETAGFDVFDVTKILPLKKYPLQPLGRLVLNRNPVNNFAEMEQIAFCPANLVPGILGSPDKVYESRRIAYREAQYHRLGTNFLRIPVNAPINKNLLTYNRDGDAPVADNGYDMPNYYPNSFNGPVPYVEKYKPSLLQIHEEKANNFDQSRIMYEEEFDEEERDRMVANAMLALVRVTPELQAKALKLFTKVHPDFGAKFEAGMKAVANGTFEFPFPYSMAMQPKDQQMPMN